MNSMTSKIIEALKNIFLLTWLFCIAMIVAKGFWVAFRWAWTFPW
jgi:hypothetical protein